MRQEVLKLAIDFIEDVNFGEWRGSTERQENVITAIKEALAQEKALQALHHENERLGLYKDAYAQPKPQIKTTDPFESSRVRDYNRGWNDCLFASGIVKQPEPLEQFCDSNCVWTDHHPDCKLAQPQQEPVAWMNTCPNCGKVSGLHSSILQGCMCQYSAPPQRTWVGLKDEDISEIVRGTHNTGSFVRAIEAKLKERNDHSI